MPSEQVFRHNMLAMYLKYHKAGLTPTTPVTSTAISPVKMSIGHKSLTNLHSKMIFLQGKPVFLSIFLTLHKRLWVIVHFVDIGGIVDHY
jgi:hypothetical protein